MKTILLKGMSCYCYGQEAFWVTEQFKPSFYLRINDEREFEWVTKL